jgi:Mg2+ and Co2+ transporter CorA
VEVPFKGTSFGFWAIIGVSLVGAALTVYILWRKKML